jgi:NTE family protein
VDAHVVLSGSGVRLPAFVGALRALAEGGVTVRRLVGTSGGALVGSFYKVGIPLDEMERVAIDTDYSPFAPFGWYQLLLLPLRGYINGRGPLTAFLERHLGQRTFAEIPDLTAIVTDLTRQETVLLNSVTAPTARVADGVYASGATPVAFEPLRTPSGLWVDGGIRYDFALDLPLLRDGLPVLGIKVRSPYTAPRDSSALEMLQATLANMIDATDRKYIEDATYARYVEVMTPVGPLDFRLTRAQKAELVRLGYERVRAELPRLLEQARR